MIQKTENGFCPEEHLFVTAHPAVFEGICAFPNTEFFKSDYPKSADIVNHYAPFADWIIVHSLPPYRERLKIKPKYWRKIVWRTWGHDVNPRYIPKRPLWNIKRFLGFQLSRLQARRFKAIGIGNYIDIVDIKHTFGDVLCFQYPYSVEDVDAILQRVQSNHKRADPALNVLVGHSGFYFDNHIEILKRLKKYADNSLNIYVLFPYGSESYMRDVKTYIDQEWPNRIRLIEEFVPYEKYAEFIANMDVVILDGTISYALGCITLVHYFKKKLYINNRGVLRRAFDLYHIPYKTTELIGVESFREFSAPIDYSTVTQPCVTDYQTACRNLHKLFDYLDQSKV